MCQDEPAINPVSVDKEDAHGLIWNTKKVAFLLELILFSVNSTPKLRNFFELDKM